MPRGREECRSIAQMLDCTARHKIQAELCLLLHPLLIITDAVAPALGPRHAAAPVDYLDRAIQAYGIKPYLNPIST